MTAVIVVTHGYSGAEMVRAAEQKVGHPLSGVATIGVGGDEPVAEVKVRLEQAVRSLSVDDVVFLVDLGGSTPFNLCCGNSRGQSAVVSGVNMPMLFKLSTADRSHGARQLAEELAASGKKSISVRSGEDVL